MTRMTIKFSGKHKSLNSFESEHLQKFSVITGKNGSGKSQLIELLTMKAQGNLPGHLSITIEPNIRRIQAEGLENSNLSILNNKNWTPIIDQHVNEFNTIAEKGRELCEVLLKYGTWISNLKGSNILEVIEEKIISREDLKTLIEESLKEFDPHFNNTPDRTFDDVFRQVRSHLSSKFKTVRVARFVANYHKKEFNEVSNADFYSTPLPDYIIKTPTLFDSQLEYVFYNYAKRRDQNRRLYFEKREDGDQNNSIPDDKFILQFVPPWESMNIILENHNIAFRFTGLDKKDFSSDANVSFSLVKTSIGKQIEFQHLSSGEKVILGLIIKIFTSVYYKDHLFLPEILILDEPDAHLHPEMSKLLIDVLNETFVKKLGISVLMVTHSPSTIALCPDNSIYQLENEPTTSLIRIEKEEALEILTGHLPTLSIDYKNHKQVFVESPTDVKYYQTIFNKLYQENKYPYRLYFMSNSYGKGNCKQVLKIVEDMRISGNKTSYGIIDWDLKNVSSDFIKVHGAGNRYNVENYIYDPIYLCILLMNLNAHNVYSELGLDKTTNQYSLGNEDSVLLQNISDWFFVKYYNTFSVNEGKRNELKEIEYFNGRKINVPKWYLEFSGHDLENRIKRVFPALEGRFTSEGKLQKEVSLIIGKCYPFIPMDSTLLIEEIINCG